MLLLILIFYLKQQQPVPGSESSKTSGSGESSSTIRLQDNLPAQQPSTMRVPTTTSVNPQAVQTPSSAIQSGVSTMDTINIFY